jgi:DNA repair protein SbcC/Rad50
LRIEQVHIGFFGPFRNRTLLFAPGLTVVFGANEAGKSTWHAALYASLCGLRRGQGATKEDRTFTARHRPWGHDDWQASVVLQLDGGRRVEIRQDLERKVDSGVRDLTLGHELSGEIIYEGTPDGSRWLGLDRRTFLATACVRQADVLDVLQSAESLQEHLQRAAATGGADETAARALTLLDDFEREYVGLDRSNSTKPLRSARNRLTRAHEELERAKQEHERYLVGAEQAEQLEAAAAVNESDRAHFEAALARRRAAEWDRALDRARNLQARYPDAEPQPLQDEDHLSRQVATALAGYFHMLPVPSLSGPSAAELRAQVAGIPGMPQGDAAPHPSVADALVAWQRADGAMAAHTRQRPAEPAEVGSSAPPPTLRELASELDSLATGPSLVPNRRRPLAWIGMAAGLVMALAGIFVAVVAQPVSGLVAVAAGAVLAGGVGVALALRSRRADLTELRADEAQRRRAEAESRIQRLGLRPDASQLRDLAARAEAAESERRQVESWLAVRISLETAWSDAAAGFAAALRARGATVGSDLSQSYDSYLEACQRRAGHARAAARRSDVEEQLRQREELEANARRAASSRQEALAGLRAAAIACGVSGDDDEALANGLRAWQQRRPEDLARLNTELGERGELRSLLGGGTLEQFEERIAAYRNHAEVLMGTFEPAELDAVDLGGDPESRLVELRAVAQEASRKAASARGEVTTLAARLPSVAGAEEEEAAAAEELRRVQSLAATLQATRRFLEDAEERVHRDIAPVLKRTLEAWLPQITGGRYDEAIVTPESLQVRVRKQHGEWRDANLLSQGTQEQIYLLLRIALVEHLGRKDEMCPLLLDEVTVQSDAERTAALLGLLREISLQRQVILFTQENDVRAWAERNLVPPQNALVALDAAEVPA